MIRKALLSLLVGAMVAGLAVVTASSASAAENRFQAVGHNLCLDGYASRNALGAGDLYVTGCNSGAFQKWTWYGGETGIRSRAENKCLQRYGYEVHLQPCSPVAAQFWFVELQYFQRIRKAGTNLCLHRLAVNVVLRTCNVDYQQWRVA